TLAQAQPAPLRGAARVRPRDRRCTRASPRTLPPARRPDAAVPPQASALPALRCRPHSHVESGCSGPHRRGPVVACPGGRSAAAARRAGASDRIRLTGSWVAAPDFLPALDLFALVSHNEGMGRALVEAMAAGVPVLATNVGGMPEVLEEGRAGLLVPPGDEEAI